MSLRLIVVAFVSCLQSIKGFACLTCRTHRTFRWMGRCRWPAWRRGTTQRHNAPPAAWRRPCPRASLYDTRVASNGHFDAHWRHALSVAAIRCTHRAARAISLTRASVHLRATTRANPVTHTLQCRRIVATQTTNSTIRSVVCTSELVYSLINSCLAISG